MEWKSDSELETSSPAVQISFGVFQSVLAFRSTDVPEVLDQDGLDDVRQLGVPVPDLYCKRRSFQS